ncbi:MAG: ABC transporter permease [Clostridium sp.]|nr:ABC transporter permease [Clostridium sp.]
MNLFKITKMDFINTAKNPTLFLCNTIFPLILIGIFGFIAKKGYGTTVTSYDYYGVTMLVYSVFNIALTTSNTFMEKNLKKGNVRLIYSPTYTSNIFFSKILASFLFGAVCYTVLMILEDKILGINLGGKNFIYVLVLIIFFTFLMCCLGAFMCCIFKSEEAANKFMSPLVTLFAIFGGMFFPVDSLGSIVRNLSYVSPVKWINECIFRIIYDGDLSMFAPIIIVFAVISVILIILCKITFKPEEYV